MAKKVYIVGSRGLCAYANMFDYAGWEIADDLLEADLVQFTGGEDVSPYLYGEEKHPLTYNNPQRDLIEAGYFTVAKLLGKPMAGICRGGQFLNVMNGGSMYQDVDGHAIHGTHKLYDFYTDKTIDVTSTHHQMMIRGSRSDLIAVAQESTYRERMEDGKTARYNILSDDKAFVDSEVIYYGETRSLCFQPHPELHGADSTRKYYFELLGRYFEL